MSMEQVEQAQLEARDRIKDRAPRMVWITTQHEGIHRYPGADSDPALATGDWDDVSFLAVPHRHIFHFKVWIEVFHNDRDIEFIQFKRWVDKLYGESVLQLDYKSCEMIADDLYDQIATRYPERDVWISVSEDNENGAFIKYARTLPLHSLTV